MRILFAVAALVMGWELPSARAQKPTLPTTPEPPARVSPPPQLIPADILPPGERAAAPASPRPTLPDIPALDDAFKQNPVSPVAENARNHAEWRALRNRVVNDADVRAALKKAEAAPTDLEKRILLRAYYEVYFGRMIALASSAEMKAFLAVRKREHLNALPQPRVRPESSASSKKES